MRLYKIKNLSILQKFLFINFIVFLLIGILTFFYVINVQPALIKNKTSNHIKTLNNTVENINRLKIKFKENDIRDFLFSTKFLFQNIDRVQVFDNSFNLIGDTDTLDLDPRAFSKRLDKIEMDDLNNNQKISKVENDKINNKKNEFLKNNLKIYSKSKELGKPFTFTSENYDQFLLITIKNVLNEKKNSIGYLAITENANDVKSAINERKNFIIRTAIAVIIVILIFSYVLNRYFLKPIRNLVSYTNIIKNKSLEKTNIENIKRRADELGTLSKSLDEMTNELNKRITTAENYSTDLLHEIRNPLTSLKSASGIISETEDKDQRNRLIGIVSHDVERIERLITDYSQMLKDEAAISSERMKKIDLNLIVSSVVDDFNSIYETKRSIKIKFENNNLKKLEILGIESRIEQIIANLLENSISFSEDNQQINVELFLKDENKIGLLVSDQGVGFDEKDTSKIFNRFYSNRPDKFGEHSGLGLNIVKNLVELHSGEISATNNEDKGARIEIIFPKI